MSNLSELRASSESSGMRLVGHTDLAGFGNCGEGAGIHVRAGKRYIYIAHERGPINFSIVDVSDPSAPKVVRQTRVRAEGLRSNTVSLFGDLMAIGYQYPLDWADKHGYQSEKGLVGVELFSLKDPENPRSVGFFDTAGDHSIGTHYVWFLNQDVLFVSTGMPDFTPTHPKDHQFPLILDVSDPSKPREIGRWWLPGTRAGDDAPPPARHVVTDSGYRSHNINVYPDRPDRAYVGYIDGGVVILDISDLAQPKLISMLDYHPPMPGFTHTVLPLLGRDLLVVSDEVVGKAPGDHPKRVWVMDVQDEERILPIGTLPMPSREVFAARPGKFGAHNIHENDPVDTALHTENAVVAGFMNAGVRVFDLADPFQPTEVGSFVPALPSGSDGVAMNDVFVDENGLIYGQERSAGGLYILEMEDFDLVASGARESFGGFREPRSPLSPVEEA